MAQPAIIVTGANGQLGKEIQALASAHPSFQFIFLSKQDLAIEQSENVQQYFEKIKPSYCINCAAYTAVDKAETERDLSMAINADAVGILAAACKANNTRFIHISTDYVFDGNGTKPYIEVDKTDPVNYYGVTKRRGEELALQNDSDSIIIRTSWVYSEYGNNFVKTMMRLMKERQNLNVVSDQVGSPTYAADLATTILTIIEGDYSGKKEWTPGIYHFSNEGVISWYDFAVAIKTLTNSNCIIQPIPTTSYPTPAKRPAYSVFDKTKIKKTWNFSIADWQSRLEFAISKMQ